MKLKLLLGAVSAGILIWFLGTIVLAQGEEPPAPYAGLQNPFPWGDNVTQAAGKVVYERSCLGCHGALGKNIPLADFSITRYSNNLLERPDYYFWLVSEGRIDRGMPAYKTTLSDEQRWQVLTYVWSLGKGPVPEPPVQRPVPQLEHGSLPDCFRCHTRTLVQGHEALGEGAPACLICHSSTQMGKLRLFDGTDITQVESPKLCGQCHSERYGSWQFGLHGVVSENRTSGIPSNVKPKCADCHDPHQPRIALTTGTVLPSIEASKEGKLDCLSCHVRVLKGHDKLGTGSEACWACHSSTEMTTLHLAGGDARISMAESAKLCGQCHQGRYKSWNEGTHGVPAWGEGEPALFGSEKVTCANCHDPHQPQVPLTNITIPHPGPSPASPAPPWQLLGIIGVSVIGIAGIGVAVVKGSGKI